MRLRHKSRSTRHLHAPYHHGPGRKRGGRVHPGLKAEGEKGKERHDRSRRRKHRDDGGPVNAADKNQAMANSAGNAAIDQAAKQYNTPYSNQGNQQSDGKKDGGGKWIQKAIKHKGGLHRALHVPEGTKIPAKKMAKAAKSKNPRIRKMVGLARTLSHMHHG